MKKLKDYLDSRGIKHGWFAENILGMSRSHFSSVLTDTEWMPQKYWKKTIDYTKGYLTLEDFMEDYESKK